MLFAVSRSIDMLCRNAMTMVLRITMTSSVVISEAALLSAASWSAAYVDARRQGLGGLPHEERVRGRPARGGLQLLRCFLSDRHEGNLDDRGQWRVRRRRKIESAPPFALTGTILMPTTLRASNSSPDSPVVMFANKVPAGQVGKRLVAASEVAIQV